MKQLTTYEGLHCANCGTPMQGGFCHECGQSIHSVLKPVHGMIEETLETVLHIDGRIVHTLPPLLLKPGFLTLEYFSGRRVPYIAPFRLMFVLCVLSFFVFHLAINQIAGMMPANGRPLVSVNGAAIESAASPAEVRKALQDELDGLQRATEIGVLPQNVLDQIHIGTQELRRKASQRLVELGESPMSAASLAAPLPAVSVKSRDTAKTGNAAPDKTRHQAAEQESRPVRIAWLPDVVNVRLTALGHQIDRNWRTFKEGDATASAEAKQRMISGVFSALPPAMFVLIPVFAILLKLFYVFRRRLYMEHLIVALHGHAFLFLSLLLIAVTGMLSTWLRPPCRLDRLHAGPAAGVVGAVDSHLPADHAETRLPPRLADDRAEILVRRLVLLLVATRGLVRRRSVRTVALRRRVGRPRKRRSGRLRPAASTVTAGFAQRHQAVKTVASALPNT